MAKLRITYTKSKIGCSYDQKATIEALGLRKLNSVVIKSDTPSIRGMIFKVQHLLRVEEVGDTVTETKAPSRTVRPIIRSASDAAKPAPVAAKATLTAVKPAADDLKLIEGIGPKIAELLASEGITTFAQLAATSTEQIQAILDAAKLPLANPETWAEQAQLAADGKFDELKRLQDELNAGRRVDE